MQWIVRGRRSLLVSIAAVVAWWPACCMATEPSRTEQLEFFEARIRPVLVEQCYECHNSATGAEGGLAVDHRQALLDGGDGGAVIVPGKPSESRLLAVLRHEVEGLEMPQGGAKLGAQVLADFERWIAEGAHDWRDMPPSKDEMAAATSWEAVLEKRKKWWSFQPIAQPEIPAVGNVEWSDHPIDHFVLAKLEANGLAPGSRAEAQTLVRRLFFVLIGLPPSPAEAEDWSTAVIQPDGYERLVDHLLDRSEFGERWARHWMDWIRYAESHGSEGDPPIDNAWHYRDYLIRALNADVPYDQLVREHVAGDLLEHPRMNAELGINESRIGPAHWRMVFHGFAPTDALDEKVRFTDDQINAFSKAFLGLTVSCARCHDHKFDAISQRDYYALFGILGSCRPGRVTIDVEEALNRNREELVELKLRIREALADDWLRVAATLEKRLLEEPAWTSGAEDETNLFNPWHLVQRDVADGMTFADAWQRRVDAWNATTARTSEGPNGKGRLQWNLGDSDEYGNWYPTGTGLEDAPSAAGEFSIANEGELAIVGIYPSGVYSHALSTKHAARLTSPDILLEGEYDLWLRVIGDAGASARYVVQNYPRSGTVYPVTGLSPNWTWQKYELAYWNGDTIHIELTSAMDAPLLVKENARSWFGIRQALLVPRGEPGPRAANAEHLALLFETGVAPPESFADLARCYVETLSAAIDAWRVGTMTDAQACWLGQAVQQDLVPNRLDSLSATQALVREYRRLEAEIPIPTRVAGLEETVGRDQPLFQRGDHKQPGDAVPRRFLEALEGAAYETELSGRRQLAEDLLRDNNPLTRRVIVNRIWHHLFGQGIVRTPDNFGSLGQQPTHPELLDWLATRFAEEGWSIKRAIRRMVTSNCWQLGSDASDEGRRIDPENHLLSHANVRRLEAEAIRDALLLVSGDLSREMFGRPVNSSSDRRSVYLEVKRNSLTPFLRVFDFPEPFTTTGRRDATNVPAQSLAMMNDEFVAERAAAWAKRVLGDSERQTDEQRVQRMFRSALGREASVDELRELTDYLKATEQYYAGVAEQLAGLTQEIEKSRDGIKHVMEPVGDRLLQAAGAGRGEPEAAVPRPIAYWEFDLDLNDQHGGLGASAFGSARIEDGALVVDGQQSHVVTEPLKVGLREKTLEAWVQLARLDQRGGGVMTVQSTDGTVFDAIVFAEQSALEWLAGSDHFRRTQPLGGSEEKEAVERPVHVALVYHADGRVVGYRDGLRYGTPYQSEGPVEFRPNETVVSFGVRHLPAIGNRMLAGRIFRAHLYDRALTDEEILSTSQQAGLYISAEQIRAALSPEQRSEVERYESEIANLEGQIEALGPVPFSLDEQSVWADLAQALFGFKEFIYLK